MLTLVVLLLIVGFALFLINRFLPLDENVKALINYLAIFLLIVVVVLFVAHLFGVGPGVDAITK